MKRKYEKSFYTLSSANFQQERKNFADAENLHEFDIRIGDVVEAKDTNTSTTYKWTVMAINKFIFVCYRNVKKGQKIIRSFQKLDYQRGAIKKV